ncbi:MAG: bifunctional folylpolyglutamate synthase/dihydrofolate synthase, partial [Sandarakinorhabdus sp.]|nr:bifunctional folylpolyglutamate synthase/dihydrofolate synthase [Sandarakinorhabdus sp.]
NAGQPITFFELTTALAFLAFAREPAVAAIVEVGMGGRMDATNVIAAPLVTGIAQLGLDHQQWLGPTILDIAREKAGIAKRGVPMLVSRYPQAVTARIAEVAGVAGAPLLVRGTDWDAAAYEGALHFRDAEGKLTLPLPRLAGAHQIDNAGLAIAMLRAQSLLPMPEAALRAGMGWAEWPARLQRLEPGPLTALLPAGSHLWVDGGHNPAAARAIADSLAGIAGDQPVHLVTGMLAPKDSRGFFKAFSGRVASVTTVPIPGHAHHAPDALAADAIACGLSAVAAAGVVAALKAVAAANPAAPAQVLVTGSLHLAGHALALNEQSAG